jgi:hypothetical protein
MTCECDWPNRRWNPASGLCESCRGTIPKQPLVHRDECGLIAPTQMEEVNRELKRLYSIESAAKAWEKWHRDPEVDSSDCYFVDMLISIQEGKGPTK